MIRPRNHLDDVIRIPIKERSRLNCYRLDRNERNQPFSEEFINRIKSKITGELFQVYPELDKIYEKIASWQKIDIDQLLLNAGSDQAIKSVFETYINPGEKILLHYPGYAMYAVYCKMFQANIVNQSFDSELNFDWNIFAERITKDIRMVVIENPNGFLGIAPSVNELNMMISKASKLGVIVLVDEAYYHFNDVTVKECIEKYDNLIISRTFSKAFGFAGLRAGYLMSQSINIDYVRRVLPAYEITSFTALVLSEILDSLDEVKAYTNETRENLNILRQGLLELGIPTSSSKANFLAVKLGEKRFHDELKKSLGEKNVLIRRPFREKNLQNWVRISTAPPKIQELLLRELREILP